MSVTQHTGLFTSYPTFITLWSSRRHGSLWLDPCLLQAQSAGGRSAGLTAAWRREVGSEILGGRSGCRSQRLDLGWEENMGKQEKQKLFPEGTFEFEVTQAYIKPMMYLRMEDGHLSLGAGGTGEGVSST